MMAGKVLVVSKAASLAREVQEAVGGGVTVLHHPRLGDLEEFVELKGPFDLVVAGPVADTEPGLSRLQQLSVAHPDTPIVLALSLPVRSALRDIVRVGAVDLVELPSDRLRLGAALQRALERRARSAGVTADDQPADPGLGQVTSVASPTGGCGKTFYATNLAWFLHRAGRRTCLVDLDLQFGEVMTALRLRPRHTVLDVVVRGEEEPDTASFIEEYLAVHDSGFSVLPAPRHPADADRIAPTDVLRIVDALRTHFDEVILDTSAQLSELTLTALEHSGVLVCMATADLPSIRNMRVFLDTLRRLHVPAERIRVVLNKVEPDMGLRIEEIDAALHGKLASVLPYDRAVSRSINQGRPVLLHDPKADISRRLSAGMNLFVDDGGGCVGPGVPGAVAGPDPSGRGGRSSGRWPRLARRGERGSGS